MCSAKTQKLFEEVEGKEATTPHPSTFDEGETPLGNVVGSQAVVRWKISQRLLLQLPMGEQCRKCRAIIVFFFVFGFCFPIVAVADWLTSWLAGFSCF